MRVLNEKKKKKRKSKYKNFTTKCFVACYYLFILFKTTEHLREKKKESTPHSKALHFTVIHST